MKIQTNIVLLYFFTFFFTYAVHAQQQEIIWLTDDNRDLSYLLLDDKTSIGLDTINLVLKNLSNFQIDFQYASLARINRQLKSQENTCVGNRLKTKQREEDNLFSLPINIHPNVKLYYLKDNVKLPQEVIDEYGQLTSLPALFNKLPKKVFGQAKERSFGEFIDQQLAELAVKNIAISHGNDRYNAISRLFFKRHIDFIIDYPSQLKGKILQYHESKNIASIEISNAPNYLVSYIACTKSPIGEQFINQVNLAVKALYHTAEYYQAHIDYLPKTDHDAFKRFYLKTFQ